MIKLFCAIILIVATNAWAQSDGKCLGPSYTHKIIFASDGSQDGSLSIRRFINGESKEELLDDTGYLSAYFLMVSLVRANNVATINSAERSETIRLLRLRLAKFKRVLSAAGATLALKDIDHLDTMLNRSTILKNNLVDAWHSLGNSLASEKMFVTAKARMPGTSRWGKEESLKEFTLPELERSRSLACPHVIGDLQFGDALQASILPHSGTGNKQDTDLSKVYKSVK